MHPSHFQTTNHHTKTAQIAKWTRLARPPNKNAPERLRAPKTPTPKDPKSHHQETRNQLESEQPLIWQGRLGGFVSLSLSFSISLSLSPSLSSFSLSLSLYLSPPPSLPPFCLVVTVLLCFDFGRFCEFCCLSLGLIYSNFIFVKSVPLSGCFFWSFLVLCCLSRLSDSVNVYGCRFPFW